MASASAPGTRIRCFDQPHSLRPKSATGARTRSSAKSTFHNRMDRRWLRTAAHRVPARRLGRRRFRQETPSQPSRTTAEDRHRPSPQFLAVQVKSRRSADRGDEPNSAPSGRRVLAVSRSYSRVAVLYPKVMVGSMNRLVAISPASTPTSIPCASSIGANVA